MIMNISYTSSSISSKVSYLKKLNKIAEYTFKTWLRVVMPTVKEYYKKGTS